MQSSWSNNFQPSSYDGDAYTDIERRPMQRASTAPSMYPAHPRALIPGHVPQIVDRSDLFFTNAARMAIAHDIRNSHVSHPPPVPPSPYSIPSYIRSAPPVPPPPLSPLPLQDVYPRRSLTSPPPVPPKLPISRQPHPPSLSPGLAYSSPRAHAITQSDDSPTNEDDLAMALALSQSEASEDQKFKDKLCNQEEEDLARALEESVLWAGAASGSHTFDAQLYRRASATPLTEPPTPSSSSLSPPNAQALTYMQVTEQLENRMEPSMMNPSPKALEPRSDSAATVVAADLPQYVSRGDYMKGGTMSTSVEPGSNILPTNDARQSANEEAGYGRNAAVFVGAQLAESDGYTLSPTDYQLPTLPGYTPQSGTPPDTWPSGSAQSDLLDDEAYARQLSAEDEAEVAIAPSKREEDESTSSGLVIGGLSAESSPVQSAALPYYADIQVPTFGTSPIDTPSTAVHVSYNSDAGPSNPAKYSSYDTQQSPQPNQPGTTEVFYPQHERNLPTIPAGPSRVLSTTSSSGTHESESHSSRDSHMSLVSRSSQGMVNSNYFIDHELFLGVSVGFGAPAISARLVQMPGAMPNVISLPYGRCQPLHIQGPNWRHLLKLMARLSGSRFEPTVEALALAKSDLRLRTVIQFVKPHQTSVDWRTILWFTIDYPPPNPILANSSVNVLPYSYTLSKIPALLRHTSDTPLSKTYTVPATAAVPYPILPITFPNLALYLQATLEDSRRYLHDSSSGMRKLSKMVQTSYPSEENAQDVSERNSVGGLFKRVIGRGNKSTKQGRGGNEETYDLVTPFVAEEWG